MDWDQQAIVGQLVTGVATLAVAVFLSSQLRMQHRDSERRFAFANETKQQDLLASWYSDESAANFVWKGSNAFESLSPAETNRYRMMYQQMYLHQLNAWRLKRDGDDLRRWRLQWSNILREPGQRRYFEQWGRNNLALATTVMDIATAVHQELESQATKRRSAHA